MAMVQTGAWVLGKCGSIEHHKKDCPKYKARRKAKKHQEQDDNMLTSVITGFKLELEEELARCNKK